MLDLEDLSHDELLREFLSAHQKYMDASANFHVYLPKTQAHIDAKIYLEKVTDEIIRRRLNKNLSN